MITDNLLVGLAELLSGDSYDIPAYFTVSSDSAFTADALADSISGEIGNRTTLGVSRIDKVVNFSAVRSGAIVSLGGDTLYGFALMPDSTGDGAQVAVVLPGLLQTTAFDIDFSVDLTLRRV